MAIINLDLSNILYEEVDFSPIPEGMYIFRILNTSLHRTASAKKDGGTDAYMSLELAVDEGKYKNRRIWENINFRNRSSAAQEIGLKKLKGICTILGLGDRLNDTSILHGNRIAGFVSIVERDGKKENSLKYFTRINAYVNDFTEITPPPFKDDNLPF